MRIKLIRKGTKQRKFLFKQLKPGECFRFINDFPDIFYIKVSERRIVRMIDNPYGPDPNCVVKYDERSFLRNIEVVRVNVGVIGTY